MRDQLAHVRNNADAHGRVIAQKFLAQRCNDEGLAPPRQNANDAVAAAVLPIEIEIIDSMALIGTQDESHAATDEGNTAN